MVTNRFKINFALIHKIIYITCVLYLVLWMPTYIYTINLFISIMIYTNGHFCISGAIVFTINDQIYIILVIPNSLNL